MINRLSLIFIVGILFLLFSSKVYAQNIQNLSFRFEGNKVRVLYDLVGEPSDRYTITLFSSANNYSAPVRYVEGDVGEGVIPGTAKAILWDARREFSEFKGSIQLKIKYKISPFQTFTEIPEESKFKRGKTHTIKWLEGPKALTAELDLYQGNEFIEKITLNKSGIDWTWEVNKKTKTGETYKLKTTINGKPAYSPEFNITRKVPIVFIIIPIVAVGVVVGILILNGDKEDEIIELPIEPN